ncbi:MAG: hypothetical protein EOP19_04980 [Hyphomicrobiales bacterium]|nr:MAG: hypothetical protein EOP19_04980 [Hyphomicrobiales bacterium]
MQTMLRTILLATTLAAASVTAMPAQAQFYRDFGAGEFYDGPHRLCLLSNSGIRRAIARQGYTNIFLNVENDQRVQARATRGKWVYLLNVNSCSGRILERQRLRPA